MKYFSKFPDLNFNTGTSNIKLKDLTFNVRFMEDFIKSIPNLSVYHLSETDRLDQVAHILYGDSSLHWILMLANGIYDIYSDMPLSESIFNDLIERQYGTKFNDAHHYEDLEGNKIQAKIKLRLEDAPDPVVVGKSTYSVLKPGCIIKRLTKSGEYTGLVTKVFSDKSIEVLIDSGSFEVGDEIQIYELSTINGKNKKEMLNESTVLSVYVPENVKLISFLDFEKEKNEAKKILLVPPNEYIPQIDSEFSRLLNDK
jgi:hypothetical protein